MSAYDYDCHLVTKATQMRMARQEKQKESGSLMTSLSQWINPALPRSLSSGLLHSCLHCLRHFVWVSCYLLCTISWLIYFVLNLQGKLRAVNSPLWVQGLHRERDRERQRGRERGRKSCPKYLKPLFYKSKVIF